MVAVRLNVMMYWNFSANAQYIHTYRIHTEYPINSSYWQSTFYFVEPFCIYYFIRFPQQLYILVLLSLLYEEGKLDSKGLSDLMWGHADGKWLNLDKKLHS